MLLWRMTHVISVTVLFMINFCNKHQHTFADKFQIFLNVIKWSKIEFVEVRRVLNGNYIFTSKRLVSNKVLPEVRLDVQLVNSLNHVR